MGLLRITRRHRRMRTSKTLGGLPVGKGASSLLRAISMSCAPACGRGTWAFRSVWSLRPRLVMSDGQTICANCLRRRTRRYGFSIAGFGAGKTGREVSGYKMLSTVWISHCVEWFHDRSYPRLHTPISVNLLNIDLKVAGCRWLRNNISIT